MLESLSVKNFALIKEAHIDFKNNLNVLTGETGSGKSILIGSINLALGSRASKDYMRDESEDTVVSIAFSTDDNALLDYFREMDISVGSDGKIIIYRKITKDKNIAKINDEPCTLAKIKEVTEHLIDIYGQHDGEDLRRNARHIMFLDEFIGSETIVYKNAINKLYDELKDAEAHLNSFDLDERMRLREIDILKYEIDELEKANLKEGEETELAERFKLASNSKNLIENLTNAMNVLSESDVSKALKEIKEAMKYDSSLDGMYSGIMDCDSIINDTVKELDKKIANYDIDEKEYMEMESRLNLIRNIISKYNNSITEANKALTDKKERITTLLDYENEKAKAENKVKDCEKKLNDECEKLSILRKEKSKGFIEKIEYELKELGFLDVHFDISIEKKKEITRDGYDDVTFMISLNPGEKMRALSDVASGGELSRIMLSIKTILSDSFGTETLIFDEIDAGISGITASKVASKLSRIAKNHQVILITHLPQIAAMADNHFVIKKMVDDDRTITMISSLDKEGMISEIGRLISSSGELTETVLANARELKMMSDKEKGNI